LLAEIAEAEGDDQREALRRAATADPDPIWRCEACHTAHAAWHAACPDCFTVGSLRWSTAPIEGPPTLQARDETLLISSE
jgi:HemY protein